MTRADPNDNRWDPNAAADIESHNIANMYYIGTMISGDLIKEARLRAGLTQTELGARIGKAQSVIARWERDEVSPSVETVRDVVHACGLELTFFMSKFDDSNVTIIDQHLRMTPAERFADLMVRVRFHDRRRQQITSRLD